MRNGGSIGKGRIDMGDFCRKLYMGHLQMVNLLLLRSELLVHARNELLPLVTRSALSTLLPVSFGRHILLLYQHLQIGTIPAGFGLLLLWSAIIFKLNHRLQSIVTGRSGEPGDKLYVESKVPFQRGFDCRFTGGGTARTVV